MRDVIAEQRVMIGSARQLLEALAELPVVREDRRACPATLSRLLQRNPRYSNLGVIALDGSVPCSALPLPANVNLRDRSYFRRALDKRDFAIGDYQVGRITGKPSVNFGYPVLADDGAVQAVVYGALDLTWLEQLLAMQDLPQGSDIVLFDSNGTALARFPHAQDQGVAAGGAMLVYTEPLHPELARSARIEVRIPHRSIFSTVGQRFARSLGLIGIVALLAGSLAWLGSETFVLRRVNALVGAARRLGAGNLGARTGLASRNDELGELAGAFDQMAADLEQREAALQGAAHELRNVNRALRTLSGGNRALLHARDEQWLVEEVCRVVVEVGEYPAALIALCGRDAGPALRLRAHAGTLVADTEQYIERIKQILDTGQTQVVTEWPGPSVLALPLVSGDDGVLGVLAIQAPGGAGFTTAERELLNETADDLAFGIRTLRMQAREQEAQEKLHHMQWYEPLTGLPNRPHLRHEMERLLKQHAGNREPLALLLLDLDRFRDINTGLGYEHGDRVLQEIGPRLRRHLPDSALIAHFGEDEFAVVLPATGAEGAAAAARGILKALEQPMPIADLPLDVSGCLGIAVYPGHGRDPETLIRAADAAMCRAKLSRRGIAVYSPERDQVTPQRLALAGELRRAIESEQLELYCQPKLDLRTGAIAGAEALLRWRHAQRGHIPPVEFIPLAEETGLIGPLTEWVLYAAARQHHLWKEAGLILPLAANLSARNLLEPGLVARVESLLATWGIGAEHFGLELTESALMQNPDQALETLRQLHGMGVTLFIDDFGTGYSSLSYLQKLPIHAIKIDKSFVLGMTADTDSYRIVESTIALAHKLGKRVVAEGVEDDAALQLLARLECDEVQGYHISRPMPAGELLQWHESEGRCWMEYVPRRMTNDARR